MKTLEVELGDGRLFQIQVPQEAGPEEIGAHIEQLKIRTEKPTDPTEGMSGAELFLAGIGRGMTNVGRQIGNIFGAVSDEELAERRELEAPLMQTGAGRVGSFTGELATTVPLAGGAVGLASRGVGAMLPAARTAMASRPILSGAGTGAAEGAIEGAILAGPDQRLSGALGGAAGGTVGGAALPFLASGFRRPDQGAQVLREMGVELTPGQMVPGGAWNQIEEAATSWPVIGSAVRQARDRPQVQFAQSMINQGRPPGTTPVAAGDPEDMLSAVYAKYQPAYDQFKGINAPLDVTDRLEDNFLNAAFDPTEAVDKGIRDNVFDYLTGKLSGLEGRRVMTDDLLKIRSDLRKQISKKKRQEQWDQADLLEKAEQGMSGIINDALPADKRALMPQVDAQYGKYKIAEDALYRAGDRGMPTPFQWQQAVRKAEANRGAYARGGGRLRVPVSAAREAFQTVSPATGQRLATLGALGGIGAGMVGMNDPMAALYVGMPLGLLAGSRAGRQFSVGASPWQPAARRVMENTALPAALIRGMLPVYSQGE